MGSIATIVVRHRFSATRAQHRTPNGQHVFGRVPRAVWVRVSACVCVCVSVQVSVRCNFPMQIRPRKNITWAAFRYAYAACVPYVLNIFRQAPALVVGLCLWASSIKHCSSIFHYSTTFISWLIHRIIIVARRELLLLAFISTCTPILHMFPSRFIVPGTNTKQHHHFYHLTLSSMLSVTWWMRIRLWYANARTNKTNWCVIWNCEAETNTHRRPERRTEAILGAGEDR